MIQNSFRAYEEMKQIGIVPNLVTKNILMTMVLLYFKRNILSLKKAIKYFERLEKEKFESIEQLQRSV